MKRVAAAMTLLLVACGGVSGGDQTAPEQDSELVAAGASAYSTSCAACHGAELGGTSSGPSLLSEVYEPNHHADAAFYLAVQQGSRAHHWNFGDMPPIPGLETEDVEAIVAFVRARQEAEGFQPYPP